MLSVLREICWCCCLDFLLNASCSSFSSSCLVFSYVDNDDGLLSFDGAIDCWFGGRGGAPFGFSRGVTPEVIGDGHRGCNVQSTDRKFCYFIYFTTSVLGQEI